jgi:hypothetical protein
MLQLPQLKRLALPVLWQADQQLQAQQVAALRADLAAAAAAAAGSGSCTTALMGSSCAPPLELLQILLVPADLHGGVQRLQETTPAAAAATASDNTSSELPLWSPEALQQLLQAVLLELPNLQCLKLTVLGRVRGPRESLDELASSLGRQGSSSSSSLHSFSLFELLLNEQDRQNCKLLRCCACQVLCFYLCVQGRAIMCTYMYACSCSRCRVVSFTGAAEMGSVSCDESVHNCAPADFALSLPWYACT